MTLVDQEGARGVHGELVVRTLPASTLPVCSRRVVATKVFPCCIAVRRAEMFITTKKNSTGSDAAATALNSFAFTSSFYHTNGRRAQAGVYQTYASTIAFNRDLCW